ncbi:MAG TPA: diacylglycerol kinase family lipid kinase, partial [Phycisphaerae bacterium]|nr:diacylglycerol kinase family lipid kinase [Phycisphaerae bacterium]
GMFALPTADPSDGLLDVCVYPCSGRGRLLVHSCYTAIRRHVERPDVIYRRAARVRIESPAPLALEADGDLAGTLPAELTVLPSRAQFCVAGGYPELP